jgi:hypothetical protein
MIRELRLLSICAILRVRIISMNRWRSNGCSAVKRKNSQMKSLNDIQTL